jgi:hypothetical protein
MHFPYNLRFLNFIVTHIQTPEDKEALLGNCQNDLVRFYRISAFLKLPNSVSIGFFIIVYVAQKHMNAQAVNVQYRGFCCQI